MDEKFGALHPRPFGLGCIAGPQETCPSLDGVTLQFGRYSSNTMGVGSGPKNLEVLGPALWGW